jgi:O-antigen/teichoic acid export membrane protein
VARRGARVADKDPQRSDEAASLARGGSFSFVAQVLNAILVSLFLALVTHSLPAGEAGGLFQAIAIVTTATVVATCGADIGLMRVLPLEVRKGRAGVRQAVLVATVPAAVVGIVLAAFLIAFASTFAGVLVHDAHLQRQTADQLRLLAPLIPLGAVMMALLAGSRAWGVIPSVAVQYLLVPALRPVLFGVVASVGLTAVWVALAWGAPVVLGFVAAVVLMVYCIARTPSRSAAQGYETARSSLQIAREFWAFAGPRFLEGVLLVFLWGVDIVMVGSLSHPRQAAIYTVATRWTAIAILGLQAVLVAIPVRISDLMQSGANAEARDLYQVSTWWSMAVSWPPALALMAFAPFFMGLFGAGYVTGSSTLTVLAVGVLFGTASGPSSAVLMMSGKTWVSLGTTALAVGINIPLNLVLIPDHGALGAAIAWTVSAAVASAAQAVLLWHLFRMAPFGLAFAVITVGCAVCFGVLGVVDRAVLGAGVWGFVAYATLALLTYGALLGATRRTLRLDAFGQIVRPPSHKDAVPADT